MERRRMMKELDHREVESVCGGSIYGEAAYAIGKLLGVATAMNRRIDAEGNWMLGAMQYGA